MKTTKIHQLLSSVFIIFLATPSARAVDWDAGGDGSSWEDAANWTGDTEPTLGTLARLNRAGGSDVYITQAGEVADRFIIGQGASGIQKLTINSGDLTTDSGTIHRIGQTSEGWLTMNGGTLTLQNQGYTSDFGGRLIVNGGDVNIGATSTVGGSSAGFLEVNGTGMTIDVTGNYNFGAFGTAIFTLDSTLAGVGVVNNTGILNLNAASTLTVDFTGYDFSANKGSDIVLFDYGTLGSAQSFGTVNFIGGHATLDYTTGGQIRLLSVVPEPSSSALLGLGALAFAMRRRRA